MKYYLTTPIYYVNDKPHIGSAYTTLAADVLARWHRLLGHDTHFLTGTAEHGTKIARAAAAANEPPQTFTNKNAAHFKTAWAALNISYDDFIRTTEPRHAAAVKLFFAKLKSSGQIYEGEYEGLYCVGHEAFVKESDLDDNGLCPDHQKPPELVKETNWFFKLSAYGDFLRDKITSGDLQIEPPIRRNEVLSFINQGLEDIAISRRNVPFALPLPWDEQQTIYVWLDELFNYCSAIGYGQNDQQFNKYWPADLHLVGKDIIKFHCVIWPALLHAIGEALPRKIFAHGFFTINGQKISKSLGNAVDPVELVKEYGADAVRYFVLREIPFGSDGDFSLQRLRERYNSDLANGLGNLVSRILTMVQQFAPHLTPPAGSLARRAGKTPGVNEKTPGVEEARNKLDSVDSHLSSLAFDKALAVIWEKIARADQLIEETKPWDLAKRGDKEAREELEKILTQLLDALQLINQSIAPFMPATHDKLTKLLAARPLKKPSKPLFGRKE